MAVYLQVLGQVRGRQSRKPGPCPAGVHGILHNIRLATSKVQLAEWSLSGSVGRSMGSAVNSATPNFPSISSPSPNISAMILLASACHLLRRLGVNLEDSSSSPHSLHPATGQGQC